MKTCSLLLTVAALLFVAGCGGGSMTSTTTPNNTTYTVSADVSGLASGTSVVLEDNGADSTTISANNVSTPIATSLDNGTPYAITIVRQPTGETCTLGSNASGTVTANTTVNVTCSSNTAPTFTLSVAVTGLSGGSLVVGDNQNDSLTFTTSTTQAFATPYNSGASYAVTISPSSQLNGQTCTLGSNATGTITANTTVTITCVAPTGFTLSVSVTGLSGGSLVVGDNQNDSLTFTTNSTQQFQTTYANGAPYSVSISSQPTGQTCTPGNNSSGTITANTTVAISCVTTPPPTFTLGVATTGLTSGTLIVEDDQGATLNITSTSLSQTFSNQYLLGATYSVSITSQPTGENCTLGSNASGTITANTTVMATCTATTFSISGTVSGYTGSGLVLEDTNTSATVNVSQGNTTFQFTNVANGPYTIIASTEPNGPTQTCTSTNGTGTVNNANVTGILFTCTTNTYTIGGQVNGLTGTGLALQDNGTNTTPITGTGTVAFTFSTPIASGNNYLVTVSTQPSGQTCTVTGNASGTVTNANITDVVVTCGGVSSTNVWTWENGVDTSGVAGTYPSTGHGGTGTPGSRYAASSWTDSAGNLWLFGGFGYDVTGNQGSMCDLWKYSPTANTWTWVAGPNDNSQNGVYPPSTPTLPGGRQNAVSWKDSSGNLWLFGGYGLNGNITGGAGILNDLWEFSTTTGLWTFVGGSTITTFNASGVYGNKGSCPSGTTCFPGSRYDATGFVDGSGNFWMFGGQGIDSKGAEGDLNDLWLFSSSSGTWTWISGSNTINASPKYPSGFGTFNTTNVPGARQGAVSWFDANGNFWLFGGDGIDSTTTTGDLNDLWEFSTATSEWAWIAGANLANQGGTYGNEGQGAAGNTPGGREFPAGWLDPSGNLWLLGGTDEGGAEFNDMWEFSGGTTGTWAWMNGSSSDDQYGTYGTQGQGTTLTTPGGRNAGSSWTDTSGNLWLFGGDGFPAAFPTGYLNDLWKYQP
jgi:hypothetical protein